MADLGTLTTTLPALVYTRTTGQNSSLSTPHYGDLQRRFCTPLTHPVSGSSWDIAGLFAVDTTGVISGTTTSGTAHPFALVYLFLRGNMIPVAATRSDASGVYSFSGLDKTRGDYCVIAFPSDGSAFNISGLDKLVPV